MKSAIYNLIIIDESGSMTLVSRATVSGCNETLNTIRSAQEKFGETQEHFVSIYLFQKNDKVPSRYIVKNEPINKVNDINNELYSPWGRTPLYDAVGTTLTDLRELTKGNDLAIGNVTIITDGLENASCTYKREDIARMIDALKEIGWSFNFIGANIDVQGTARSLNIDNALEFDQTDLGTGAMFAKENGSRMGWFRRTHGVIGAVLRRKMSGLFSDEDADQMHCDLRDSASNYFDKDDSDD